MIEKIQGFFIQHYFFSIGIFMAILLAGLALSPFQNPLSEHFADLRVSVDAIPDLGENQQIVFTEWPGNSAEDVEEQVTFPLAGSLMGISGVKAVRTFSMFGFSTIYLIFAEDVDFQASRTSLLEKLSSLPSATLPAGIKPVLGPDASAIGQIYMYYLEARNQSGQISDGFTSAELRTLQDQDLKYRLLSVEGVAEVAAVGGFVREYQLQLDPQKMAAFGVSLTEVAAALRDSNRDVGAKTMEYNRVEYILRGLGRIKSPADVENIVLRSAQGGSLKISDIGNVSFFPAQRRGVLDNAGRDVAGGIVVSTFGENPMRVIERIRKKVKEIQVDLPVKTLDNGEKISVHLVPYYDRGVVIKDTITTLESALILQVIITSLVICVFLGSFGGALLLSSILPLGILGTFILMRLLHIEANAVALAGIAIAIGVMADVGIVLVENIAAAAKKGEKNFAARVLHASAEVFLPVTIAVATTVLGFLPVFFLTEAEGKLFRPLAATKTLTIVTALFIALFLLPPLARFLLHPKIRKWNRWLALPLLLCNFWLLGVYWQPLGQGFGNMKNIMATVLICGLVLLIFYLFYLGYEYMLRFLLRFRFWFLSVILLLVFTGFLSVFGAGRFFALFVRNTDDYFLTDQLTKIFPGIGTEFMPTLQEGSFLYMPTTMTHAGVEEVREIMAEVHERIAAIPEVEMVVGKAGRAESALDPAPLSMIESVIQYKPEFAADAQGKMVRQWRKEINSVADIWDEVVRVTKVPGLTSAPFLQPIAARIVMLQSGMRAPLGIKLSGQDLDAMEVAGLDLETIIREVPGVRREAVFAERIVGKPYLEVHWDREKLALHGLSMGEVQRNFEWGVGGVKLGEILIGRTRFPLTMRYFPVKRNSPEDLAELPIRTPAGLVLRLSDLGILHYRRGPQVIRGENARLISYVIFDKQSDISDGEVIERVRQAILQAIAAGRLKFGKNISWSFAGSFENQARANKRLLWIVPLTLLIIFALIAAKFSFVLTMMIFSSIMVAWSGGFLFLWFLNSPLVSAENPYLSWLGFFFPLGSVHLSVAVWVGFLSLFGIATDDGVLIAGFLRQEVGSGMSRDKFDLYENIVRAGKRRIRACLMTTATTVVALLPVLTATGKGSELMIPMALPVFGGMMMALLTLFVVPVLYSFTYFFKK